jgi:tRNA threonylcarbamoyladenosine biosynthesis protein TsaB
MKLLALETSSAIATIALVIGGDTVERSIDTPREQTERMLPLIDELLEGAGLGVRDLDAIVFGRGPGSFTGLRVAAALAQGLALAADRPIVAVSSLAAAAQRAWRELGAERSLVCVDARMGELYSAAFAIEAGRAQPLGPESLGAPETVEAPRGGGWGDPWCAVGNGWRAYRDALAPLLGRAGRVAADLVPSARDLIPQAVADLEAGRILSPAAALPVYLRSESAWRR